MKQLCSAANSIEAHNLRLMLAAHGIEAKVLGDNNPWEGLASLTPSLTPSVHVEEADFEQATALLEKYAAGVARASAERYWTCRQCGKQSDTEFELCWNCQSPRGSAPLETAQSRFEDITDRITVNSLPIDNLRTTPDITATIFATRRTWTLWLEIVAILAIVKPWYGGSSPVTIAFHAMGVNSDSANFYLPTLFANAFAAALVFAVVRLNRDPIATLGIAKPSSVDIVTGGLTMVVGIIGSHVGVDLLYSFLTSIYDKKYVDQLAAAGVSQFHFNGWNGFVSLVALAIAIGFSEELVARGFLIPRLEHLFHGTASAVLASAVLFSLFHWYRGIFSMWSALIVGVVFGTVFASTRRLWPLVLAHTVMDLHAFLTHLR